MSMLVLLLPLLAQAGALNGQGVAGLNLPQIDRPARVVRPKNLLAWDIPLPQSRLKTCLDGAQSDAGAAAGNARIWLKEQEKVGLSATAQPLLCLGSALSVAGDWAGAEAAFTQGRGAATSDVVLRAQLGGMAGNAALAQGAAARALPLLDGARGDAISAARPLLAGGIAMDRARALVALGRNSEAETALVDARTALPEEPQAWLLSATLARRLGKLADAQRFIENAANLAPRSHALSAEIGVEAGVIAMLGGREDAARKSWVSVVAAAPGSEAGQRASAYLAQVGAKVP